MDDLIGRKATMDFIKGGTQGYHPQGYKTAVLDILDLIEQQDTALDLEGVIAELEEKILCTSDTKIGIATRMAFEKCIEIIKSATNRGSDKIEVTVDDLINLLDKDGNKRGGATGKKRKLSLKVNGEYIGYITSAELDGWGDGLIAEVCLVLTAENK